MNRVLPSVTPIHPITICRNANGRGYRLESSIVLPQSRERIFAFFSDAFQLEGITPPQLKFRVATPAPIDLHAGAIIDYRLRVFGLPLRWQSLISVWEPPRRFVDEQVRGPYRKWRHEHVFEETAEGTIVNDVVDYDVPGGPLVQMLLIKRDLLRIFEYRARRLHEMFPS